jgi:hypothetical protein
MKTSKLIGIWFLTFAVALFFHGPILAYSSLEDTPFCLSEGAGLLEAEAVRSSIADVNEFPAATIDHIVIFASLPSHHGSAPHLTDIPRSSILRV